MKEHVWSAMNDRVLRELEPRPQELKLATSNNFGLNIENILKGLGFVTVLFIREGDMLVVSTPEKLLDRDWAIYFQDKEQDPLLFTICLNHGPDIGYIDFLRQIKNQYGYVIFMP